MLLSAIDGIIGAGKSVVLECLSRDYIVLNEPLSEVGLSLLEKYYINPVKYAYEFQIRLLEEKYSQLSNLRFDKSDVVVMERSVETDRYIFVESLFRRGILSETEYGTIS